MLIPHFMGGLGNMMFQLASTYSFAKQSGHEFGINNIPMPPVNHSITNYNDNIFKPWLKFRTSRMPDQEYRECNPISPDVFKRFNSDRTIKTNGYFQNAIYTQPYKDEIIPLFELNREIIKSYHDISDAYFLHVRRGDYVGNTYHEIDFTNYYRKAISHIGSGIAYIVTNDIPWCENWSELVDVRHQIIKENDVDTLSIMSQCAKGGIAVNSSFSWWGLYLNTSRPNLIIPNRWFPHNHHIYQNYVFPEATVLTV